MANIIADFSPGVVSFLRQSLSQLGLHAQRECLFERPRHPTRAQSSVSRQARSARVRRAQKATVAAGIVHAINDPRAREFVLSRDFARLKPYSPSVFAMATHIAQSSSAVDERGCRFLWDAASERFLDLLQGISAANEAEAAEAYACFGIMAVTGLLGGASLQASWEATARRAIKCGVWDNPVARASISLLGSGCGSRNPYIDFALDDKHAPLLQTDLICFAREDCSAHHWKTIHRLLQGVPAGLGDSLHPTHPVGTVDRVFCFLRMAMRNRSHFSNLGLIVGVLLWSNLACEMFEWLQKRDCLQNSQDHRLRVSIRKTMRVLVMEKQRLHRALLLERRCPIREKAEAQWLATADRMHRLAMCHGPSPKGLQNNRR